MTGLKLMTWDSTTWCQFFADQLLPSSSVDQNPLVARDQGYDTRRTGLQHIAKDVVWHRYGHEWFAALFWATQWLLMKAPDACLAWWLEAQQHAAKKCCFALYNDDSFQEIFEFNLWKDQEITCAVTAVMTFSCFGTAPELSCFDFMIHVKFIDLKLDVQPALHHHSLALSGSCPSR